MCRKDVGERPIGIAVRETEQIRRTFDDDLFCVRRRTRPFGTMASICWMQRSTLIPYTKRSYVFLVRNDVANSTQPIHIYHVVLVL